MRADFDLQPFRSAGTYSSADLISVNVRGDGDWNDYFTDLFDSPAKLLKPHKDTLLHEVARNIDRFYTDYWIRKVPDETAETYVGHLEALDVPVPAWLRAGEDIMERRGEIVDLMGEAFEKAVAFDLPPAVLRPGFPDSVWRPCRRLHQHPRSSRTSTAEERPGPTVGPHSELAEKRHLLSRPRPLPALLEGPQRLSAAGQ